MVTVPLGKRVASGLVWSLSASPEGVSPAQIKPLVRVVFDYPVLSQALQQLAHWIARYYACGLWAVLQVMLPARIRNAKGRIQDRLLGPTEAFLKAQTGLTPAQLRVRAYFEQHPSGATATQLTQAVPCSAGVIRTLLQRGWLQEDFEDKKTDAQNAHAAWVSAQRPVLNAEQKEALGKITVSLDSKTFAVHLLQGVTGSGKTEVYLGALEAVLAQGGGAIVLVPEVILTSQTIDRMRGRLQTAGVRVVVWHSLLSDTERMEAWFALLEGRAQVVVGPRSALFLPVQNLRLIVVDEEHEPAYKQDEAPRYHGRDVAIYRCKLEQATCVLGSATPSLESLYNVQRKGYVLSTLTERVDNRSLPLVHVVDMRTAPLACKLEEGWLSAALLNKTKERLQRKEQVILFINRRGFAARWLCVACGFTAPCPHCSVHLTYHKVGQSLRCHWCGYGMACPKVCPQCQAAQGALRGFGTQRIEAALKQLLPQARIERIDADTMSEKGRLATLLDAFRLGKVDILVGTQMIAKGLDFPNVTLVGLIDADLGMHVQDFRAAEKTFQLVVQVAGRSGRGDLSGEVVLQTFAPQSTTLQYARKADVQAFVEWELQQRSEFGYPPYRHLVRHVFRCASQEKLLYFTQKWVQHLQSHTAPVAFSIRGPSPAPIERIKGLYRHQVWYFTEHSPKLVAHLLALQELFGKDSEVQDFLDVDANDML
jgi:primosomal protein N' (replication factor Y)